MTEYERIQALLRINPRKWLVTGVAGFIGSHLLEELLLLNQHVVGLDNLSTGTSDNLVEVRELVNCEQWSRFRFLEADIISSIEIDICSDVDYVLHQAALGSVPRSIKDPLRSHSNNVTGFLNVLLSARYSQVRKVVYASSSSVYGDHPHLPKKEEQIGRPLSPYAATKLIDEIYAGVMGKCYNIPLIGLRYFNVFGPRQNPTGEYAAVIPKWISALLMREQIHINGDGESSRDFCFVKNVVQANILAATAKDEIAGEVYNIALGNRTTLNELLRLLRICLASAGRETGDVVVIHDPARAGDVRDSLADITKAFEAFGYAPRYDILGGIDETIPWFVKKWPSVKQ